jgi:hypothetical protein
MYGRGNQEPVPAFPQILASAGDAGVRRRFPSLLKEVRCGPARLVFPGEIASSDARPRARNSPLEELFGGGPMVLRTSHMRFDAADLGLESLDPRLELLEGHGVEILLCKCDQRIVGLAREEVVQIHGSNRLTAKTPLSISDEDDEPSLDDARHCGGCG